MVALLFNVNTKLSVSFFWQAKWKFETGFLRANEEGLFLCRMYDVELPCGVCAMRRGQFPGELKNASTYWFIIGFTLLFYDKPSSHKKYLQ